MKIPFFKQEKDWTCGAACLRMALGVFRIRKSEAALYVLLEKEGEPGTPNRSLPEAAEKLKLNYVVRRNSSFSDVKQHMKQGFVVIISYFDVAEQVGHFGVVKKIDKTKIHLLDPWHGPSCCYSLKEFLPNWRSGFDKDKQWFIAVKP